ncbi:MULTISPECIES: hypothetical protein [Pseudoalteromonas]|uniref:Uncharacterized protein n=1 Tax=Pseudoalteromonas fuliginea TaxID=1872678 RepID=A0AB73BFP0_9GAMM|nr:MULTISPECIES: hypothetical protein [Pseudoalteromonas]KAA1159522.1 hypothetical protein EU508_13290 [Pseudoalteromonas fuliginea]PKG62676.1 hypothetical protein CXF75_17650 [Pseudoalteromonas arctica]PKG70410.1 hypothetical protein CXF64_10490 [Pseudoalteromonas sp. GutCa3]
MFNIFIRKSRAQRIQERIDSGNAPSGLAVDVTGNITAKKYNKLIRKAVKEYNSEHDRKVFIE